MKIDNSQFKNFVVGIKNRIISSQKEALRGVNKELINLYWDIGKSISKSQEENGWGKSVVENLSFELRRDFVGVRGFSVQNLWNMRQFYLQYSKNEKLQTLSREIGWSHNVMIFQKCKDELEREFYIKEFGCKVDVSEPWVDKEEVKAIYGLHVKDTLVYDIKSILKRSDGRL